MKNIVLISLFAIIFTGCAITGYDATFIPWYQLDRFPQEAFLKQNETPTIMYASDMDAKFREITSRWYWCIGETGFTGEQLYTPIAEKKIREICTMQRAKIAVWNERLINTERGIYSRPHTNFHSYASPYGYTSTYTTTTYSVHSYEIDTYHYSAYFFIPIPPEYRMQYAPGFSATDLTQQDRQAFRQNTGCRITVVYENTVAFYANLFPGDIITRINGRDIYTSKDLYEVRNASKIGDTWDMTFVRNGQLYRVVMKYDLYYSNNS